MSRSTSASTALVPPAAASLAGDHLAASIALALRTLLTPALLVESSLLHDLLQVLVMPSNSLCSGLHLHTNHCADDEVAAGQFLVLCFDYGDLPDS